jgi:hypothetical protein
MPMQYRDAGEPPGSVAGHSNVNENPPFCVRKMTPLVADAYITDALRAEMAWKRMLSLMPTAFNVRTAPYKLDHFCPPLVVLINVAYVPPAYATFFAPKEMQYKFLPTPYGLKTQDEGVGTAFPLL